MCGAAGARASAAPLPRLLSRLSDAVNGVSREIPCTEGERTPSTNPLPLNRECTGVVRSGSNIAADRRCIPDTTTCTKPLEKPMGAGPATFL